MKRALLLALICLFGFFEAQSQPYVRSIRVDSIKIGSNWLVVGAGDSLYYNGINIMRSGVFGVAGSFAVYGSSRSVGASNMWASSTEGGTFYFNAPIGRPRLVLRAPLYDSGYVEQGATYQGLVIGPNLQVVGVIYGSGAGITALNATNLSSGTVNVARLPVSGVTGGTYYAPMVIVDAYGRITSIASGRSTLIKGAGLAGQLTYFAGADSIKGVSGIYTSGVGAQPPYLRFFGDQQYPYITLLEETGSDSARWEVSSEGMRWTDSFNPTGKTLTDLAQPRDYLDFAPLDSVWMAGNTTRNHIVARKLRSGFVVDTMEVAVQGAAGDTVAVDVRWGSDFSTGSNGTPLQNTPSNVIVTAGGTVITSFTNATIPANTWIWYRLTKKAGNPVNVAFILKGHYQ